MSEVVLCSIGDGVATLTLNRPERLNAWTQEMEGDYADRAPIFSECAQHNARETSQRQGPHPRLRRWATTSRSR
jgi:hypothetical protein